MHSMTGDRLLSPTTPTDDRGGKKKKQQKNPSTLHCPLPSAEPQSVVEAETLRV